MNWPQRPGNPLDDVSFPARRGDRPCDIIMEGKGGAIRHVTDLALAPGAFITGQQPLGPLSSLVYTSPRGSKSLLTAALAWTLDDATTSLPHHVCTSAVSGAAGVGYHPILCHDSTSPSKDASALFAKPASGWLLGQHRLVDGLCCLKAGEEQQLVLECSLIRPTLLPALARLSKASSLLPISSHARHTGHDLQNFQFIQELCFGILLACF